MSLLRTPLAGSRGPLRYGGQGRTLGLLVDTTMQGVSMALLSLGEAATDAGILWRGAHLENAGSVLAIADLLAEGLAAVGAAPADLAGIGVAAGPGSFTGIKVGLAFVHGLRRSFPDARPLPVLALCSLEAAAATLAARRAVPALGLLLPATRTHGYFAAVSGGVCAPARLVAFLGGEGPDHLRPLSSAAPLCVFAAWPAAAAWSAAPLEELAPSAVCAAAIYGMSVESQALWPHGFGTEAPAPRYLRLSTAEEKLASSQKGK